MSEAAKRLIDAITKADESSLAAGVKLSTRDVWTVLSEYYALRINYAEALEEIDDLKDALKDD